MEWQKEVSRDTGRRGGTADEGKEQREKEKRS